MGRPRSRSVRRKGIGTTIGLILLYGLLLWLLIAWSRAALWPRLIQVQLVADELFEASSQHRALVVRTEYVLRAPAEGTFQLVVNDGEYVRAGSVVARVVNDQEQRRLTEELDRVDQELAQARRSLLDLDSHVERTMIALRGDLQAAVRDWRRAVMLGRYGDLDPLADVMDQIGRDMEQLQARLESEQEAVQGLDIRREGLITARDNVIAPVTAPVAGVIMRTVDGLEEMVTPSLDDVEPEDLFRIEPQPILVREGSEVEAGTAIMRLVDTHRLSLLVALPVETVPGIIAERPLVKVGSREFRPVAVDTAGPVQRDRQVVRFHVDRDVPELLADRFVTVEIIEYRGYGVVVPIRALVSRDGVDGIYVVSRTIVRFTPVTVGVRTEDQALVEGIASGTRIVVNPWLVRDGMSLP